MQMSCDVVNRHSLYLVRFVLTNRDEFAGVIPLNTFPPLQILLGEDDHPRGTIHDTHTRERIQLLCPLGNLFGYLAPQRLPQPLCELWLSVVPRPSVPRAEQEQLPVRDATFSVKPADKEVCNVVTTSISVCSNRPPVDSPSGPQPCLVPASTPRLAPPNRILITRRTTYIYLRV